MSSTSLSSLAKLAAMDNKEIIETAIHELFDKGDVDAATRYVRDDFVDHGPGIVASSKAEWIAAIREQPIADFKVVVHRLLTDGDYVTMWSRRWIPEGYWIAVADIWRFEDGLVAEHGEVFQQIPETDRRPDAHSLVPW